MKIIVVDDVFVKKDYVHVKLKDNENYEMIYRAAKKVYWDESTKSLYYKGKVSEELALKFICEAMENEYYTTLVFGS